MGSKLGPKIAPSWVQEAKMTSGKSLFEGWEVGSIFVTMLSWHQNAPPRRGTPKLTPRGEGRERGKPLSQREVEYGSVYFVGAVEAAPESPPIQKRIPVLHRHI